ncbi:uncharacterized protein LOC123697423 isoform X1 [Colias croceus]|uniref:uncharacterized protein LOC123697423 isoform X1 n=1 Tax=Colias crocea TaxID=72248 RepID=UPI001E27BA82|nr:uncharacterized protein LOC123697423 isoform X1 [Colias croceus]
MQIKDEKPTSILRDNEGKKEKTGESKNKSSKRIPLRILIIEPSGRYCRTIWCAIGLGTVHVLIGAVVMSVIMYSLKTKDAHAAVCTAAYHFFAVEAILSLNYANGWSTPMRIRHRRFAHVLLQMCAMAFAVTGTVLITTSKGLSTSAHGLTGTITAILSFITFLLGPCALFGGRYLKLAHVSFGIPTFIMSSICLCCGLYTKAFREWASPTVIYVLIGFIVFYTSFIMITCFIKCAMRI